MLYLMHQNMNKPLQISIYSLVSREIHRSEKKWSRLIRSINHKTELITGNPDPLILSVRPADDRRMHIYQINTKIFSQIKTNLRTDQS